MSIPIPLKDQRTEVNGDGEAPEDGNMDCVPTSLAAIAQALTDYPVNGGRLRDHVYGQGYIGLHEPMAYVDALASLRLRMALVTGSPSAMVARAFAEITAGHPVLLAIPSDWDNETPSSQFAHMVAGCDIPDPDTLVAMNPWGGFYQSQPLAWWEQRLYRCVYKGLWIIQKAEPGGTR